MPDTAWEHKRITYKAHGGEKYVVFANFHDDRHTHIKLAKINHKQTHTASILIDDIYIYQDGTDKTKSGCKASIY